MNAANEKFASSIGCMDGRDRAAIAQLASGHFVDDVCTGPGTVGILAHIDHPEHEAYVAKFRTQVSVSYLKHGSRKLFVSGHKGCAGHPVDDTVHKADIMEAAEVARGLLDVLGFTEMSVVPVWNEPDANGTWTSSILSVTA